MIESPDEKGFKLGVAILFADAIDKGSGDLGFVGVQLQKSVVAALELLPDFLGLGGSVRNELRYGGGGKRLGKRGQSSRKHGGQRRGAVGIFLKGVQTLVIPAGINLLRAAFAKRDMDVDRRGLTDAVESPDALLEEFGIPRQIE